MSDYLKPCPFCGSYQITTAPNYRFGGTPDWAVMCKACGTSILHDTEAEAITAWNTRTSDATIEAQEAEIVRLREALTDWVSHAEYSLLDEIPSFKPDVYKHPLVKNSIAALKGASDNATSD